MEKVQVRREQSHTYKLQFTQFMRAVLWGPRGPRARLRRCHS